MYTFLSQVNYTLEVYIFRTKEIQFFCKGGIVSFSRTYRYKRDHSQSSGLVLVEIKYGLDLACVNS
jgi:hypothetical protein